MKMPPIHRRSANTVSKVSNSLKRPLGSFLIPALALHTGKTLPQTAKDKTAPQIKCCLLDITLFFEEPIIFCEAEKRDLFQSPSLTGSRETSVKHQRFFTAYPFCNVAIHETLNATGSFQAEGLKQQIVTIQLPLNPSAFFTNSRQFQSIHQMPNFSQHNYRVWPNFKHLAGRVKRLSTGDFAISQLVVLNVKFTVVSPQCHIKHFHFQGAMLCEYIFGPPADYSNSLVVSSNQWKKLFH